jgi:hypothetical protein
MSPPRLERPNDPILLTRVRVLGELDHSIGKARAAR